MSIKKGYYVIISFFLIIFNLVKATDTYGVSWTSDSKFLAVGESEPLSTTANNIEIYSYDLTTNSLTLTDSRRWGSSNATIIRSVNWSADDNYLAVTIFSPGTYLKHVIIYSFDKATGKFTQGSQNYSVYGSFSAGSDILNSDWSDDGNYLIVGGASSGSGTLTIFNVSNGVITGSSDSLSYGDRIYSPNFNPTEDLIAFGAYDTTSTDEVLTYSFGYGKLSTSAIDTIDYASSSGTGDVARWHPDGRHILVSGRYPNFEGDEIQVYKWDGQFSNVPLDSKDYGTRLYVGGWSADGRYFGVAGLTPTSGYEVQLYSFDKYSGFMSQDPLANINLASTGFAFGWSPDGRVVAYGGASSLAAVARTYYKGFGFIKYDGTTYNIYFDNHVILKDGDNAIGNVFFNKGFTIPANSSAYLDIPTIIEDGIDLSVSGTLDLGRDLNLGPNITFSSGGVISARGNKIILNGDLAILDNSIIEFSNDAEIDGQGNNLILGHRSHFLLDDGVTLTLKNLKLQNDSPVKISSYPFEVKTNDCKFILDDVVLALNGNITFSKGELFIRNDVMITGSAELVYSSPDPSFINSRSCLYFDDGTSFYYNQNGVSTNMSLLIMQDETSAIYLNGATLRTTDTGLKLTKGILYLDNKVTLSSYLKVPQTYSNGLIFGDSELGSDYDLSVYINGGARVELYGKLWEDSLNTISFVDKNSRLALADENSKFKVTNPESFDFWKQTSIIRTLPENNLFLMDNQEWTTSTTYLWIAPQESFELLTDLIIPDYETIIFYDDLVLDGNGNKITLGRDSQLLIDGGVCVTFKNLKVQNSFNTSLIPPIKCMDWHSQLCLDNVELALNDDCIFRNGQIFINNDVQITGTSKFSYRSVRPSYIQEDSSLIFSPQTTFEFYPSTTYNNLIKMVDKTSKIVFDQSTLQTTHTGIKLTKGSVYFDNKVTLTSTIDNTYTDSLYYLSSTPESDYTYGVAWSPNGRYLAVANRGLSGQANRLYKLVEDNLILVDTTSEADYSYSAAWTPDGRYLAVGNFMSGVNRLYRLDGESLTLVDSTSENDSTVLVAWSPNGRYLATANFTGEVNRLYRLDGESLTLVDSTSESDPSVGVEWSSDGKYLAVGNYNFAFNRLYRLDGESLTLVTSIPASASVASWSVAWNPDGKYLAIGRSVANQLYRVDGESFSLVHTVSENDVTRTVSWSPDGQYLAVGNYGQANRLYKFEGESLTLVASTLDTENTLELAWSPDGRYLAAGNYSAQVNKLYKPIYRFDTTPQGYSNSIVFGDSSLGSEYNLEIYLLSAARLEVFGKVFNDNI